MKGSKNGEQHIAYTQAVKRAMKEVKEKAAEPTRQELYEKAKKLRIEGRSKMTKSQLEKAVNDSKK